MILMIDNYSEMLGVLSFAIELERTEMWYVAIQKCATHSSHLCLAKLTLTQKAHTTKHARTH